MYIQTKIQIIIKFGIMEFRINHVLLYSEYYKWNLSYIFPDAHCNLVSLSTY
jgi:hypothetical protein